MNGEDVSSPGGLGQLGSSAYVDVWERNVGLTFTIRTD